MSKSKFASIGEEIAQDYNGETDFVTYPHFSQYSNERQGAVMALQEMVTKEVTRLVESDPNKYASVPIEDLQAAVVDKFYTNANFAKVEKFLVENAHDPSESTWIPSRLGGNKGINHNYKPTDDPTNISNPAKNAFTRNADMIAMVEETVQAGVAAAELTHRENIAAVVAGPVQETFDNQSIIPTGYTAERRGVADALQEMVAEQVTALKENAAYKDIPPHTLQRHVLETLQTTENLSAIQTFLAKKAPKAREDRGVTSKVMGAVLPEGLGGRHGIGRDAAKEAFSSDSGMVALVRNAVDVGGQAAIALVSQAPIAHQEQVLSGVGVSQAPSSLSVVQESAATNIRETTKTRNNRKAIMQTAEQSLTAYEKTVGISKTSYQDLARRLNDYRISIPRIERDVRQLSEEIAAGQDKENELNKQKLKLATVKMDIVRLENRLFKGKETGGQFHEAMQVLLDAKVAVTKGAISKKDIAARNEVVLEAAKHRIALENANLAKLEKQMDVLGQKIATIIDGTTIDPKLLAQYQQTATELVKSNNSRNEAMTQIVGINYSHDDTRYKQHKAQQTKLQNEVQAKTTLVNHYEQAKSLKNLSECKAFLITERQVIEATDQVISTKGSSNFAHSKFLKTPKEPSNVEEATPYELWLRKKAENEHDTKAGTTGIKFADLASEEQYKVHKGYVRENTVKEINNYGGNSITPDRSSGGLSFKSQGSSRSVEVSQRSPLDPVEINIDSADPKMNTILHIKHRGTHGQLLEACDLIEIKDGRIVSIIQNTGPGAGTSRLNMKSLRALQRKLDNDLVRGVQAQSPDEQVVPSVASTVPTLRDTPEQVVPSVASTVPTLRDTPEQVVPSVASTVPTLRDTPEQAQLHTSASALVRGLVVNVEFPSNIVSPPPPTRQPRIGGGGAERQ